MSVIRGRGWPGRRPRAAPSGFADSCPSASMRDGAAAGGRLGPGSPPALTAPPRSAVAVMEGRRAVMERRLLDHGHEPLGERDLVELLLFGALPLLEVKPLARRLVEEFGDLGGVVAAPRHRLMQVEGATERVHLQLKVAEAFAHRMARARVIDRCAIASWDDLLRYCKTVMAHRSTEQVRVLYLDRKNVLIADEAQGEGTVDHVPVYPREVVRRALELNASAVILVHNHPSGDPEPSEEDVAMTARIEEACRAVGVTLHDHLVIGRGDRDASFRALGLLSPS